MKKKERVKQLIADLRALAETDFERHRLDVLESDLESPPVVHVIDENTQEFNGVYYKVDSRKHYNKLHRDVYTYYKGAIPRGYVIHHINCDPSDNNIDNLLLMTAQEHNKLHMYQESKKVCKGCKKEFVATARAQQYCSSKCANKNAKKFFHQCAVCGAEFYSVNKKAKRCPSCRAKRIAKSWDELDKRYAKICCVCGKKFKAKDAPTKCCSKECHDIMIQQRRAEAAKNKQRKCVKCGELFSPEHQKQRLCRSCRPANLCSKESREERTCIFCGCRFETYKKATKKFCSPDCLNQYQQKIWAVNGGQLELPLY